MNVDFTKHVRAYLEVAGKDNDLISSIGVGEKTSIAAKKVFDDVASMMTDRNPIDIASITTEASQVLSDMDVNENVKFHLLSTILFAIENEQYPEASNEDLVNKIVQSATQILQPPSAMPGQTLQIEQRPSQLQALPPPPSAMPSPMPHTQRLPPGRLSARKLQPERSSAQLPPPAQTLPRQPGRLGDRASFLYSQAKTVKPSFNRSELAGVNVSERRKTIEHLMKAKEQVVDLGKKFLGEIKGKLKQEPMYQQAMEGMNTIQQKELFVAEMEQIHEDVSKKVDEDLQAHMKDAEKLYQEDPDIAEKVKKDLSILLDGVPPGMSIEKFLALSYIYHSYERALELDMQKWNNIASSASYEDSDECKRVTQKQIALNYYKYFYDNLTEMQKIRDFENVGKQMRQMEVDDVAIIVPSRQRSYDFPGLATSNTHLDLVGRLREKCKRYVENGGGELECLPFQLVGSSRLEPPRQPPSWLLKALSSQKQQIQELSQPQQFPPPSSRLGLPGRFQPPMGQSHQAGQLTPGQLPPPPQAQQSNYASASTSTKSSVDRPALTGVNVAERRRIFEELMKAKSTEFLKKIKETRPQEAMYGQAMDNIRASQMLNTVERREKFVRAIEDIHEEVVKKVEADLQSHLKDMDKIAEDANLVEQAQQDSSVLLDGVPAGMSTDKFLALCYVLHSYIKAIRIDEDKWESLQNYAAFGNTWQCAFMEQEQVALNYYQAFHDHVSEIEKIKGYEGVGKLVREMEVNDAVEFIKTGQCQISPAFTQKVQASFSFAGANPLSLLGLLSDPSALEATFKRNLEGVFRNECRQYIERGGDESAQPFRDIGFRRLPPPQNPPIWLLRALA